MHEEEKQIKKRILELADKSYRNSQYLFTSFLTPAEYSEAVETLTKEHYHNYDSYGGTESKRQRILPTLPFQADVLRNWNILS